MAFYKTRRELRDAIEKLAGKLDDETWNIVKPENKGPYDRFDLLEICSMMRLERRKQELSEAARYML